MIVDDDKTLLRLMEKYIKSVGTYEVFTAGDGFQAGLIVEAEHLDAVVLDIVIPGLDGVKVCEIIKSKNKDIRVIAITGYDDDRVKKKILNLGADDYLVKPFDFGLLLNKIEGVPSDTAAG